MSVAFWILLLFCAGFIGIAWRALKQRDGLMKLNKLMEEDAAEWAAEAKAKQMRRALALEEDPDVLREQAHVVTVRPNSGRVLVYDAAGQVIRRYPNAALAREGLRKAGLDFDNITACKVQTREAERLHPPPPDLVDSAVTTSARPEWTQADAEAFRVYLASASGRKFTGILQFDEQRQNRSAVLRITDHAYNSGFAAGFHARSESLMQLSADVRPQQDEHSGERDGATPLADRTAP